MIKNKLLECFGKHRLFCSLLFVALIARLLFFFDFHEVWWDSGVYIGMAKYLWSFGSAGLWEHIRPVLWPFVLGFGWFLGFDIVWFARFLELAFSLVSILLVYLLGRKLFSERAALLASAIWAFSRIVFLLGFHEYTEIPEVVLVLGALLAFVCSRWFLAGFLAGLAFLAKFPAGLFLVVLLLPLVFRKQLNQCLQVVGGFAIPAAAFLLFNQAMYGSAFAPLIDAQKTILQVLGCNVLRYEPWWKYFVWVFSDNWLNIFSVLGIFVAVRGWKRRFLLPLLALALPLVYVLQLHCRDYRYAVVFLPMIALFAGRGLEEVCNWFKHWKLARNLQALFLLFVVVVSVFNSINFYLASNVFVPDVAAESYYKWLANNKVDGEIWTSNPVVAVYTDALVNKIYYPVYGAGRALDFNSYLFRNYARVGAVFLDNCGGGIVCPPEDAECRLQLEKTRSFLNLNFRQVYFARSGNCWYSVYAR